MSEAQAEIEDARSRFEEAVARLLAEAFLRELAERTPSDLDDTE